ncbi:hypothetical protein SteCoe_19683 [Stentor coeruleus]|uniref:RanBP-type and C3HC4-type zinc finger-containing protein 1 n=1 Tax=Stentor coeruleus TaxID=5963 RepID=A0A1R2BTQ8_9CILI|nr:hypothetical protein SteCoe_19683 [Stentor coeruleus]
MENSNFQIFAEITKEKNEKVYMKFIELGRGKLEKAIEMFFSQAKNNSLMAEIDLKRKVPSEEEKVGNIKLGSFITEAVSLRSLMQIPACKMMYYKFNRAVKSKKNETTEKSIRFSLEKDAFSVAKLNYLTSELLYPLINGDLILLEINTITELNINTLDTFQVMITVTMRPDLFSNPSAKMNEEAAAKNIPTTEYCNQRESFSKLIQLINIKKTQSALINKNSTQKNNDIQPSQEMSEDEKSQCLKHFEEKSIPLTKPVNSFKSILFPYQAQALTWMLERETQTRSSKTSSQLHHLWEEYTLENEKKIYINSCTGQISLSFPQAGELCKGGILADEMGLGKTVMMISLIHTSRKPLRNTSKKVKKSNEGGTLIILPLSLISQWKSEFDTHGEGISVLEYYTEKSRNMSELISADVILTTYGVFCSESSSKGYLTQISWFRVILDEAHTIRNRNTSTAKAVFKIQAEHKWALTGTPIQNTIDDLYSLIRFLEMEPWSDYTWWNRIITHKFLKKNSECFSILQRLLKPIMLRRTKDSKQENGQPIVVLPNLNIHDVKLKLENDEKYVYDKLFSLSKAKYTLLVREGKIKTHVTCIFELLLRLRQYCDHPYLVMSRGDVKSSESLEDFINKYANDENNGYLEGLLEKLKNGVESDCPVCLETCDDPVMTKCAHVLCRTCATQQIEKNRNCPLCKTQLGICDLTTIPRDSKFSFDIESEYKSSAKIDFLLTLLNETENNTVVFTQWITMLDILEITMKRENISYSRLDGSMSKQQRENNLQSFKSGKRVLLVSLKSGGQGLNLICASQVVLFDPWWNPAVEHQAIERVHRIGQRKEVNAYRLVTQNTVEEKIVEMQNRKEKMIEGAFSDKVCSLNLETLRDIFQGL